MEACVVVSIPEKEHYFTLPGSPIQGIPLYNQNNIHLDLGFIEVGCKQHHKRGQLNNKKELFYKYWGDTYVKTDIISWHPRVFRMLAHYDPTSASILHDDRKEINVIVYYSRITQNMLDGITEQDKENIFRIVTSEKKKKSLLEEILENKDATALHRLIKRKPRNDNINILRGKMAEILVLKDIERSLPQGMNLFKNGNISYFNERYKNGTEVDGILTFYGPSMYKTLLDTLEDLPYIRLRRKS